MKFTMLLTCGVAWAQGTIDPPRMGVMVDGFAHARPVFGVSASVSLGEAFAGAVVASSCSDSWCIFKTRDAIGAGGVLTKAPPGPALLAIDGATALMYFPLFHMLARWRDGTLEPVAMNVTGTIVGLRSNAGLAQFAVRRNAVTWIVDADNQAIDSIPSASGPVILLPGATIYTDGDDVVLRRADGSELRFPAPGARSFLAMATNYVQIRAGQSSYALRIDPGHERIFELPEPAQ
jgi:hypothetical protein